MKAVAFALYGDYLPSYGPVKLSRDSVLRTTQTDIVAAFASNVPHGLSHSISKSLQTPSSEFPLRCIVSQYDDKAWKEYFSFNALRIFHQVTCISGIAERKLLHRVVPLLAYRSLSLQNEYAISDLASSLLCFLYKQIGQEKLVRSCNPETLTRAFEKCLS